MIVVTIVVRRSSGLKSAENRGRDSVPASLRALHAGDSGSHGRTMSSGSAGIKPETSV